jgi:hypothetical protein
MFVWQGFPEERPKHLRDKLVIAWVAYHSSIANRDKAECHLSVRHLEMIMSFSSMSVTEACLKRLMKRCVRRHSGWLEVSTPAAGAMGHHYCLGHRASGDTADWVAVGRMLFGAGGCLESYRTRPIFRGSGLGPEGCIVLACVERCGPVTPVEAVELLESFLSESTVRKRLRVLESEGLVKRSGENLHTTRRLAQLVEQYEIQYDLVAGHLELHARLLGQSLKYQVEIQGGPQITTLKAALRKDACFYCKSPAPPTGGTVEHFPPAKWGGSDEESVLLPACHSCNKSHGPLIGRYSENVINRDITQLVDSSFSADDVDLWKNAILVAANNYAAAMNARDVQQALDIAKSVPVSIWAALRRGSGSLRVVNGMTGEVNKPEPVEMSPDLRGELVDYAGVAELLSPRPRVRIESATTW